jgi:hypothetical protein
VGLACTAYYCLFLGKVVQLLLLLLIVRVATSQDNQIQQAQVKTNSEYIYSQQYSTQTILNKFSKHKHTCTESFTSSDIQQKYEQKNKPNSLL